MREGFDFLLADNRFQSINEEKGPRFWQAYFQSPYINLRVAIQEEVVPEGKSATCLAFLIDPQNSRRWCMFEKAVQVMLGEPLEGSRSPIQLQNNLKNHIDPVLAQIRGGMIPPFEDFSRFT